MNKLSLNKSYKQNSINNSKHKCLLVSIFRTESSRLENRQNLGFVYHLYPSKNKGFYM
jgi:mannose/fructose/N-acetylgalactosamine-specific phosphotransferase system component IID